jgi:hypothetical protein
MANKYKSLGADFMSLALAVSCVAAVPAAADHRARPRQEHITPATAIVLNEMGKPGVSERFARASTIFAEALDASGATITPNVTGPAQVVALADRPGAPKRGTFYPMPGGMG